MNFESHETKMVRLSQTFEDERRRDRNMYRAFFGSILLGVVLWSLVGILFTHC